MFNRRFTRAQCAPRKITVEALERRALLSGAGPLVISEFMADNSTGLRDENLEYSDWIEIHNPTAAPIDANGYYLTDDAGLLTKWRLPSVNVPANGYITVFASDKDRTTPRLHTNFKLASDGEYLALVQPDGVTVADEFSPEFPLQVENVSYGVLAGAERYFTTPTPGAANVGGSTGLVSDTVFSVDRGFFDAPFELRIATLTPGATIRYTLDGTRPTATTGVIYGAPLTIDKTTIIRAAAFKPGLVPTDIDTQTYIFLSDVVTQTYASTLAAGFPSVWGSNTPDYGLDPDVLAQYSDTLQDDLKSVPTLSIVLPIADMFGPNGIYSNSTQRGDAWERATSVELIDPNGGVGGSPGDTEFQVNAGIQIQGGAFRGDGLTKKHSFRLLFKDKWGVPKLNFPFFGPDSADRFDSITLRADNNDGWQWSGAGSEALYARDLWSRMAQRAMGHPSADGNHVQVYINGIYWGMFNPTERPDAAFAESYIGGDKEQWDVLNQDGVTDGTSAAWNTMLSLASAVQSGATEAIRTAAYQRIQGNNPDGSDNPAFQDYLDVDSLIDYMLLNFFTGNADWPHRNWYAGRLRADNGIGTDATGFKFFSWDAESALDLWADVNTNRTGVTEGPAQPYTRLRASADFRARFADRVQVHMFGNGALSTAANKARMAAITAGIDRAIVAESARWGDQHVQPGYTRAHWAATRDQLLADGGYFDRRWGIVLGQLRAAGLYGALDGPSFSLPGGRIAGGEQLQMTGTTGTIYYTLDGSDPRLPDGTINPAATAAVTGGATLVSRGSVWSYLDNGSNQGTAWRASGFDHSGWASGPGQLGYGDGDEATTIGFGPNAGAKYITTYFRKTFTVDDPAPFSSLRLRVLRDDGAIVYLNGQEVARSNMPSGNVGYTTPAAGVAEDGTYYEFALDPARLVSGSNVFAVEIHQVSGNSSDKSFDLELIAPAPPVAITLSGGLTRLRARARDAAGNWSALSDALFHTDAAASAANVVVTEVNYHPHAPEPALGETVSADKGDYEFIELMNTSAERVTLAGARLWLGVKLDFPVDAYLNPGERAVVVKNVAAFRSRYGAGPRILGTYSGNLGNDGQLTILQDARRNVISSFRYSDSGDWPNRADGGGASIEVIDPAGDYNDPDTWRSSREFGGTPGAPGSGPVPGVVINEVLTNTDLPALDAIELFNPTLQPVDLGGWYLSDSATNYRKFRIPAGTVVAPGGYLVFEENALGFALDGEGDDVWLMQAEPGSNRLTRFVDRVEFGAAPTGESWGRWPDGLPFAALYPMGSRTIGGENTGTRVGPVVINEVLYAPAAGGQEFIELRNLTDAQVSLDGWRFTAGIDFEFPAGTVIAAQGYLVIAGGEPAELRAAYAIPDDVPVLGPFSIEGFLNVLDNAGERLTLSRPGETGGDWYEVERVRYGNAAPWPPEAGGSGASLARRNSRTWVDAAANWAAEPSGGSPGRANFGGAPNAAVVGRNVFYNNSAVDGRTPGASFLDLHAIAPDKQALLPGGQASFANITSYTRGLSGVTIDLAGLAQGSALNAADFQFHVGNSVTWSTAPAPVSVTVRGGAGAAGSDRVTLVFADNSIRNTWLRVTVAANSRTGLTGPDVFYFGNLVGETGDAAGTPMVSAADVLRTRRFLASTDPAALARYDFNHDNVINTLDQFAARANQGRSLPLFDAPASGAGFAQASDLTAAVRTPVARRTAWNQALRDLLV